MVKIAVFGSCFGCRNSGLKYLPLYTIIYFYQLKVYMTIKSYKQLPFSELGEQVKALGPANDALSLRILAKETSPLADQWLLEHCPKFVATGSSPTLVLVMDSITSVLKNIQPYTTAGNVYSRAQAAEALASLRLGSSDEADYRNKRIAEPTLIDGFRFRKDILALNATDGPGTWEGILAVLQHSKYSYALKSISAVPANEISYFVPIVLRAKKLHWEIPYMHWNPASLYGLVSPKLADSMLMRRELIDLPPFSPEELRAEAIAGLTTRSGVSPGKAKSASATYDLNRCALTLRYGKATSNFIAMMYAQTWLAHPANRTPYTVVDPIDWDNIPEPIWTDEVLVKRKPRPKAKVQNDELPFWTWNTLKL